MQTCHMHDTFGFFPVYLKGSCLLVLIFAATRIFIKTTGAESLLGRNGSQSVTQLGKDTAEQCDFLIGPVFCNTAGQRGNEHDKITGLHKDITSE